MDELAKVQTESGIIWVLAASVPRVLELAQKGREGKEAKHNGKSGERTKQARLLFVHGARCCASATRAVGYVPRCRTTSISCGQEAERGESRVVLRCVILVTGRVGETILPLKTILPLRRYYP